jgi:hypothetical protein
MIYTTLTQLQAKAQTLQAAAAAATARVVPTAGPLALRVCALAPALANATNYIDLTSASDESQ